MRAFIDDVQWNLASSIRGHFIMFHHRVPDAVWLSVNQRVDVAAAFATTELIVSSPKVSHMVLRYCYGMVVQMCTIIRRQHLAVKFAREIVEKAAASNPFRSVVTLIQRLLGESRPVSALFVQYMKNLIDDVLNDNFLSSLTCASVHLEKMVHMLAQQNSCMHTLSNQIKAKKQLYRNAVFQAPTSQSAHGRMRSFVVSPEEEEEDKHNTYEWG